MGLREIEQRLDHLENALRAAKVPESVKQEVDSFCIYLASELVKAQADPETERRELFERFNRTNAN